MGKKENEDVGILQEGYSTSNKYPATALILILWSSSETVKFLNYVALQEYK
jgi:hypothetical protein